MVKSAFGPEKILHQSSAFIPEDASCQLGFGMKGPACYGCFRSAAPVAILIVFRPKNHTADLAPVQGAGTHQTGLYGNIKGGFGQVLAAEMIEGGSKRDDLRVSGTVGKSFCLIVAPGDDAAVHYDDGADGHFVFFIRLAGFFQRLLHVVFVVHVGGKDRLNQLQLACLWIDDDLVVFEVQFDPPFL